MKGHWKLLNLEQRDKKTKEKGTVPKGPVGHCGSLTRRRKGYRENEELMTESFLNLMKYMNINIEESQ